MMSVLSMSRFRFLLLYPCEIRRTTINHIFMKPDTLKVPKPSLHSPNNLLIIGNLKWPAIFLLCAGCDMLCARDWISGIAVFCLFLHCVLFRAVCLYCKKIFSGELNPS